MNLKIEEFVKERNLENESFCNVWKKYEDFLQIESREGFVFILSF